MRVSVTLFMDLPFNEPDRHSEIPLSPDMLLKLMQVAEEQKKDPQLALLQAAALERMKIGD